MRSCNKEKKRKAEGYGVKNDQERLGPENGEPKSKDEIKKE